MNWKTSIILFLVFASCQSKSELPEERLVALQTAVQSSYLIEVNDLKKNIGNPNIELIDFRKKATYAEGHIAGALNIWRSDIEDSSFPYGGIMASPSQLEILFSQLGISNNDTLIIYDDNGLCDAARLWWLLQNYDFTQVKLLHGGMAAWKEIGEASTTEVIKLEATSFQLTDTPSMKYYLSKEALQNALTGNAVILDTRSHDEFSGKRQKKGAAKGGRIPKSILIDWAESVDYNSNLKFKSLEALEAIYSQLNADSEDTIIVYCHSGVRSAHTTFVLTQLLNFQNVKNYDGSWTEWSYLDEVAFVQDSLTTLIN